MTRGEGDFFVKTAPSPLVLSPSPKKLSSGRGESPRRCLSAFCIKACHTTGEEEGGCWEVKGVLERREADDAGGSTGAARQPARFVAISGRREREAILSDMRSVMLRLGDAPAGKADAVPDFQQCLHRPSIRQGRCRSRAAGLSPRGERSRMSGRPQAAKKPSMRRASSFPMADRLPGLSSGGRTVMSATGHACRTV